MKKLTNHLRIRYEQADETELFALAKKNKTTPSDYVRKLIRLAIKKKIKVE